MSATLAPIVVFCYNRPHHLRQTLDALKQNTLASVSDLIVFSDGAKNDEEAVLVAEVRAVLAGLSGFKSVEIVAAARNQGLARSVIAGVSRVLQTHESVIVLEDDMLCTPDFLDYMDAALRTYRDRPDIFSVTGYTPPIALPAKYGEDVYLAPRASSWGWGTWRDRWQLADWKVDDFEKLKKDPIWQKKLSAGGEDLWPMLVKQQRGAIDSWAIRWTLAHIRHGAYGLYPAKSKIQNIGTDGSGTNFTFKTTAHGQELAVGQVKLDRDLQPNEAVLAVFRRQYAMLWRVKVKNWVKYGI